MMNASVYLFCLFVIIIQISANPILQALFPQACQVCQQNGPISQYSPLPFILQPTNNQQSYPQALLGQNLPNHQPPINPAQTQGPCQHLSNQNPITSTLFNKILSNPNLRTILDPNSKLYNQNGAEMSINGLCNNSPPNIVNNYIIVPPEFLLEDANSGPGPLEERKGHGRRKDSHQAKGRKKQRNGCEEKTNDRRLTDSPKVGTKSQEVKETNARENKSETIQVETERRPRRRKNKNPEIRVKISNETATVNEFNQIEAPLIAQKDIEKEIVMPESQPTTKPDNPELVITTAKSIKEDNNVKEYKSDRPIIQTEHEISSEKKTKRVRTRVLENNSIENPIINNKPYSNHNRKSNDVMKSSNARKAREEAAIKDFRQKFPNIPEVVVRNLLDHMKKQLEKQQLGAPGIHCGEYPLTYEELYKPRDDSLNPNKRRKHRRRKNRKNNSKSNRTNELPDEVALTTTSANIADEVVTSKIEDIATTVPTTTNTNDIETTTVKTNILENNNSIKPQEKLSEYLLDQPSELGSEDELPVIYMNSLVDEYYPDFTNDNQYYNDEDYPFQFFDDRFHYTTDKNYEFEELNRERRKLDTKASANENTYVVRLNRRRRPKSKVALKSRIFSTTERPLVKITIKDEELIIPTTFKSSHKDSTTPHDFDIMSQMQEPKKTTPNEIIEFRTPPTLEIIDFETKPVNKEKVKFEFPDKFSTFSDVKTPHYGIKEADKTKHKMLAKDEIETVFARSKVVTYGKPSTEEFLSEGLIDRDENISQFTDNDKTIVLAKTISDGFWR